jgi:hypothetical protein
MDKLGRCFTFDTNCDCGFTKFDDPIPNKKDSVSHALCDNSVDATLPATNPLPGKNVFVADPY